MELAIRIVRLAARLLMALGVVCLLLGAYLAWQTWSFQAGALRATGRVVSYLEVDREGSPSYRPRVRFVTPEGSIHTIAGRTAYTSRRYAIGTELPLSYHPLRPGEARIATFAEQWLAAAVAAGIGAISLIAGILVRRSPSVAA
jgi:hypothetical protein